MNTNCVMTENMPLIFSIANQTMVNALRVNNHPPIPLHVDACVCTIHKYMHLQNYRPSSNFYGRAHHDKSRLWPCFGQWSMYTQNQCARSRSRFDQLMSDWY